MDKDGRKLGRGLKYNDNPAATLAYGARTGDVDLVINSLEGVLGNIPLNQQRQILKEVADIVASTTKFNRDKRAKPLGASKAFEVHGPDMGKVTLEEFVSTISNAVIDAMNGTANKLIGYSRHQIGWNTPNQLSKPQLRKHLEQVFDKYSGSFVISCSSPIRIYALHETPSEEEKVRRKKEKKLRIVQVSLLEKREALEKATAREKKLKIELAKLTKDEERYKKSVEKAEEEVKQLKANK